MPWLLIGYMYLFLHRPFEVWPEIGEYRVERIYMLITLVAWALVGALEIQIVRWAVWNEFDLAKLRAALIATAYAIIPEEIRPEQIRLEETR